MKLIRVHIIRAATCGGLLDGLDVWLRHHKTEYDQFDPMCLVGANGAGKSQFLQVVAEIFQSAYHTIAGDEERAKGNDELEFEIEYLIRTAPDQPVTMVRLSRRSDGKRHGAIKVERLEGDAWIESPISATETRSLLPSQVVGYTSGDNETLSLPFLVSRSGYADAVGTQALSDDPDVRRSPIPATRLMLVDYGTHLEVLVSNLLLGSLVERQVLLGDAKLRDVHSFRCIIQLAHSAAPKLPARMSTDRKRKGIQLTDELEGYIEQLKRCSTAFFYEEKTETYRFDFWVNDATRRAFRHFWTTTIKLYSALHKLAMLNDLAIPRPARERLKRDIKARRFASRLPEPQDEDRVFRFEQLRFMPGPMGSATEDQELIVEYVSLSDGEHQLAQILGTMCMLSQQNVLFLLDEPESHFNPRWRVKFVSRLNDLPTAHGQRGEPGSHVSQQDCLLTTHAPFVPSDMARERVLIFEKKDRRVTIRRPENETFGTSFDTILEECFDVKPPMSEGPRREIDELMKSTDPVAIQAGLARLGDSIEKVFLMDHLRQLTRQKDQ